MKRLEALEQKISFRRSRIIVYEAHADTTDSDHEALLQEVAPADSDLVIWVARYGDEAVRPRIVSVNPV
jgi:hypothetical protein